MRTACVSVWLSVLVPSWARAEDATVRLTVEACPTLAADRVRTILGAELGGLLIAAEDDTSPHTIEVVVACDEATTTLTATEPATGASLVRHEALEAVHPRARERFVALAIAELITALGIEFEIAPEPEPEPAVEPAPEPAPEPVVVPEPTFDRRTDVTLFGEVAAVREPLRGAYGGGLRVDQDLSPLLGFAAILRAERGEVHVAMDDPEVFGRIDIREYSLALEAKLSARVGMLTLAGALGGRVGYAVFQGHATAPTMRDARFTAPTFAPHVALRAFLRPKPRLVLYAGLELAYYTLAAHALAEGVRSANIEGVTFGTSLGIGASF